MDPTLTKNFLSNPEVTNKDYFLLNIAFRLILIAMSV